MRQMLRSLACLALWGLVLATVPSDAAAQVLRGGPPGCKAVALTFDMCPVRHGSGFDEALIRYLREQRIPATFFLSGRWIARHDAEVRGLLAVPFFEIGTHGQDHAHLPLLDGARRRDEILGPHVTLEARYGRRTTLFRPPYGEYDERGVQAVNALGLRFVLWNLVSGDPDASLSRDRMTENLLATVRNGSMIVFHANGKGPHTREVVEDLYRTLVLERGYKLVTVTELFDRCMDGAIR